MAFIDYQLFGQKGCGLSKEGMADLILRNNIRWDQALLKQIQLYKRDGTVPWLAGGVPSYEAKFLSLCFISIGASSFLTTCLRADSCASSLIGVLAASLLHWSRL